ncbi:MAG TPA: hypothetical protein VME19_03135 [Streptosporangiaceae bacterium]|nr:hypothetical protein [Streptosporangiaceae bacterium]
MRIRRLGIYTAASVAAIATAGLLASPAFASTTQYPWQQGQAFSLYNNYGNAHGTASGNQYGQYGQYGNNGHNGQYGQYGQGSVTVSGSVSSNRSGWYNNNYRRGTTEEVFLSSNSWQRGELIGSASSGQTDQFSGTVYNTDSATITLCTANQWGGNVRNCTSQTVTVNNQQYHNPGNYNHNH